MSNKLDSTKLRRAHFAALGYEPLRMKPVHFANGFFLAMTQQKFRLELLNIACVVKHKDGLSGDYAPETLRERMISEGRLSSNVSVADIKKLRVQLNGVFDNDDGVNAAFGGYSTFGNDYTLASSRFVTEQRRLDGYAGFLVQSVLARTEDGRAILEYAKAWIETQQSPLEKLAAPILDPIDDVAEWNNRYEELYGNLGAVRLNRIAKMMRAQTAAMRTLCENTGEACSHYSRLRAIVVGLCTWLFVYLQKSACEETESPVFVMDFLGGENVRLRAQSRSAFTRQRELCCGLYVRKWESEELECDEEDFTEVEKTDFKFLEQHFSDLAIRIGIAQPRAAQARRKHFELQPDTARLLVSSVIPSHEVQPFPLVARSLRDVWGVCLGGCDDDHDVLEEHGYSGLDQDEDLEANAQAFVALLKRLNLAVEPSDGLVLCAANPEDLV